jgi:hypothetical protein
VGALHPWSASPERVRPFFNNGNTILSLIFYLYEVEFVVTEQLHISFCIPECPNRLYCYKWYNQ